MTGSQLSHSPQDAAKILHVKDMEFELVLPNFMHFQSAAAQKSKDSGVLGREGAIDLRQDGYLHPESPVISVSSRGHSPDIWPQPSPPIPPCLSRHTTDSQSPMEAHRNCKPDRVYYGLYRSSGSPQYVPSNSHSATLELTSNVWNLVAFGAVVIFSLIKMSIATWITAKYNANHIFPTSRAGALPTLHVDLDNYVWVSGFSRNPGNHKQDILASVASHFFLYILSHFTFHPKSLIAFFQEFSLEISSMASSHMDSMVGRCYYPNTRRRTTQESLVDQWRHRHR